MTVKDFKDLIIENGIPDDAEIIIMADHGQHYEYASDTVFTRDNLESYRDLDEVVFEYADFTNDYYDDDALADYPFSGQITGVVFFGD